MVLEIQAEFWNTPCSESMCNVESCFHFVFVLSDVTFTYCKLAAY